MQFLFNGQKQVYNRYALSVSAAFSQENEVFFFLLQNFKSQEHASSKVLAKKEEKQKRQHKALNLTQNKKGGKKRRLIVESLRRKRPGKKKTIQLSTDTQKGGCPLRYALPSKMLCTSCRTAVLFTNFDCNSRLSP